MPEPQTGGLSLPEVVYGIWPLLRSGRNAEERRPRPSTPRNARRRYRVDVRRLQRMGSDLFVGVGAPGRALPSALDGGDSASGKDRELRQSSPQYRNPRGLGRALLRTLGGGALSPGRRTLRRAGGP